MSALAYRKSFENKVFAKSLVLGAESGKHQAFPSGTILLIGYISKSWASSLAPSLPHLLLACTIGTMFIRIGLFQIWEFMNIMRGVMLCIQSLLFLYLLGRKLCCFTKVLEFFIDARNKVEESLFDGSNGYKVGFMERSSLCYFIGMEDT